MTKKSEHKTKSYKDWHIPIVIKKDELGNSKDEPPQLDFLIETIMEQREF